MKTPNIMLSPKQLKHVKKAISKLPPISSVAQKILVLTTDPNTNVDELATAVEGDQILAAKVIRLVNSPFFGLDKEVTSIRQAVIFLGFNSIRQLVMSVSFGYAFDFIPKQELEMFWKHSIAVAILSRKLAGFIPNVDKEALFASGLLHDLGILLLYTAYEDKYQAVLKQSMSQGNLSVVEKETFGIDHSDMGFVLGYEWNFPSRILDAIYLHHKAPPIICNDNPFGKITENRRKEVEIITLSDYLSIMIAHGLQTIPDIDPCWSDSIIYQYCQAFMPPSPEMVSLLHQEVLRTIKNYSVE